MRAVARKLVGTVVMLIFVMIYVLTVIAVGASRITQASDLGKLFYFLVFGLIWVVPAGVLIRWMQKPDASPPEVKRR